MLLTLKIKVIFLAKMGLFGNSRELQPRSKLATAKPQESCFIEEKGWVGRAVLQPDVHQSTLGMPCIVAELWQSHWLGSCGEEEGGNLSSSCWVVKQLKPGGFGLSWGGLRFTRRGGHESTPCWPPDARSVSEVSLYMILSNVNY